MSSLAGSATSEVRQRLPRETCCYAHKGKLITLLVCAALALMVSGGLLYYFSIFKNIVCYSLMGAGGAVGLGAIATSLILYQACSTPLALKTQLPKRQIPEPKTTHSRPFPLKGNIMPPPPTSTAKPNHAPPPKTRDPLEHLTSLRQRQGALPLTSNPTPSLGSLCLRTLATQEHNNSEKTLTRLPPDVFSNQAPRTFRFAKDLQAKHIRNLIVAWPEQYLSPTGQEKGSSATELYLNGCNHIELDSSILVHQQFKLLSFTGCKFKNLNTFAINLSKQSHLHTLTLGHESLLLLSTFQNLISGCSQLRNLTISVNALPTEPLFLTPNQLEYLNIEILKLTPRILTSILSQSPQLKILQLRYTEAAEATNIGEIIKEHKSNTLRQVIIIVDAPYNDMQEPFYKTIEGVDICLTHTYSQSLFQHAPPHEHTFWHPTFEVEIQRYAHDPEKVNMLLRQIAQRGDSISYLNQLSGFGISFARLNWMDWLALEHIFAPFDLEFPDAPAYNFVLELLLHAALTHCLDKMEENGWSEHMYGPFYRLNSEVLTRILNTHRVTFQTSSAMLSN